MVMVGGGSVILVSLLASVSLVVECSLRAQDPENCSASCLQLRVGMADQTPFVGMQQATPSGGAVKKSIPILAAMALMLAGGFAVMFAGGMVNTVHPTSDMIGVVMHKDAITTITQEDAVTFDKGPANPMVMYQCCNSVAASCSACGAVCTNCNYGSPCAYCSCAGGRCR